VLWRERGSADKKRDQLGFGIKFYTEDDNWDLVGNNARVFFVKNPKKVGILFIPKNDFRILVSNR